MSPFDIPPGSVLVMVGPAGSGKSTLAQQLAQFLPPGALLSLDQLRAHARGRADDQSATKTAVRAQNLLLRSRLRQGVETILDSTNVEEDIRHRIVRLARRRRRQALAILMDTPLETCLDRAADRPRFVCPCVIRKQHHMRPTRQLLLREGFRQVLNSNEVAVLLEDHCAQAVAA
ncbi:AAA family ATPase [Streptomyces sp. NRRL F-2890]|uniref:AAA family ATPase n=1 Tax=Streptomyces sp. NRRL F-2890 TaxID=1463845 RepID=UPI0004C74983|nr:AAA family ATPase [Streptomyces sp. NRRL F-2890]